MCKNVGQETHKRPKAANEELPSASLMTILQLIATKLFHIRSKEVDVVDHICLLILSYDDKKLALCHCDQH